MRTRQPLRTGTHTLHLRVDRYQPHYGDSPLLYLLPALAVTTGSDNSDSSPRHRWGIYNGALLQALATRGLPVRVRIEVCNQEDHTREARFYVGEALVAQTRHRELRGPLYLAASGVDQVTITGYSFRPAE